MKRKQLTRRAFIYSTLFGVPLSAVADALWLEPTSLRIHRIDLSNGRPTHRFVHFTDVHHKGDQEYLERVVDNINGLAPDFVCFTGDLIEENRFLTEALNVLKKIRAPLYGVPGNHDYWSRADFDEFAAVFDASGGAWLQDSRVTTADGEITLHGAATINPVDVRPDPKTKNIMLIHYPESADALSPHTFDAILAGHTHGGQVRIPFYGPLVLPWGTGSYDLGLFKTKAGPLYVSSGIGWFTANVRFMCRPEIVLFEI